MNRRIKVIIASVALIAAAIAGVGFATGSGSDNDDDIPITGEALIKATEAALEHTGGGVVTETETEVQDEEDEGEGFYEVEVRLDDGSQMAVHLDENFNVLGSEADDADNDD